ncbi:MAG: hypothetical protein CMI09_13745 [Oceanospirillaceae bacterium]|nr:hypothetical protein [Oceanospirillaceae bacterium]
MMIRANRLYRNEKLQQKGSAMILSLAILALLTVGAAFSMQRSTLQVRMINNMQYKQQVSNATYTYVEWMLAHLNEPNTDTGVLSDLIKSHKNASDSDSAIPSISLYSKYNWQTPVLPNMKAVVQVTDTITIEALPSDAPNSRKFNEGNSQGAEAPYFFKAVFLGSDDSGNITSTMEQGFIRKGPAPE